MEHTTSPSIPVSKVCTGRAHCPTYAAARRLAALPIALERKINEMEQQLQSDHPEGALWKDRRLILETCELIAKKIKFLGADIYDSQQQIQEGASKQDTRRYKEIKRDRKMVREIW